MSKDKQEFFTIRMTRALEDNVFAEGKTIFEMMEIAGKVVAEEIIEFCNKESFSSITIFSGYGNNGGDSIVAAKLLLEQGFSCFIVIFGNKDKFDSLASQKYYEILLKTLPKENWFYVREPEDFIKIPKIMLENGVFLDALLGIGVTGDLREPIKTAVEYLNSRSRDKIIALDIPSGYNPESQNEQFVKHPNLIICLGRDKVRKDDFTDAQIVVRNIGIPEDAEKIVGIGDLKWFYPKRKPDSHKRQNGVVTVIAGSKEYIGAPALVGFGAFRTGADLIFILTPSDIRKTVSSYSPDFITIPAAEGEVTPNDIEDIFNHHRTKGSAYVIGPGMMDSQITKDTLLEFLKSKESKQVVIDASALSSMEEEHLFLLKFHQSVLTPHKGEFLKIFKKQLSGDVDKDAKIVSEVAAKWKTTIVLKGQTDIISNGKITKFNKTGHPGMTVGGTGDVLTGIIGALLAVIDDPFLASCLGVYISGAAGELAAKDYGDGLMASDIPNYINRVIEKALAFRAKEI
ncbi:MAG: NAD(P)H-hydrate dehydratase [Candidatus Heimdallarchaeaceae archaeon]